MKKARLEETPVTDKKVSADSAEARLSFEGALARLGAIVGELESGELTLEESLARFEEGVRLSRASQAELDDAEARIEELLGHDGSGDPILTGLTP